MTEIFFSTFAIFLGFTHSFEADHLVAVLNLVSKPSASKFKIKEGLFWGIGHSLVILILGFLIILAKQHIEESIFSRFEAMVGCMLIILGFVRLHQIFFKEKYNSKENKKHTHHHGIAFSVGSIHGLAGSGAVVALVISKTSSVASAFMYLVSFGLGSILGMFLLSYVFGKLSSLNSIQKTKIPFYFSLFAAICCLVVGGVVCYENLMT